VWERRLDQPGFGTVRLGLADQASRLKARRGGNRVSAGILRSVPFTVDLRAESVGLAGPFDVARSCARWLVGQLAVAHSPADLRFVFLVSDSSEEAWTWTRWLPHDRSVAVSPSEHAATTAALRSLVDTRLTDRGTRTTNSWSGPWTVLVVDPSGDLVDVPGLVRLLGDGTQVGVSGICVDDRIRRLPASCSTVAAVDDGTGTSFVVRRPDGSVVRRVSADQVTTHWAERVARGLAPLADAGADTSATIPATCFLFDLLGLDRGNLRSAIVEYWRSGAGRPRTAVGLSAQGLVELDLISDGPHVLVAGTTGSGKSEFLRSLIAGLSIANGPGDIAFLLIDYKGGATFADCGQLPHTLGVVTDLDAHLTRRVLRSLDAELRRR
jgi:S-DNA-T family DNA segregation ATPase FtsK/SpoIIIE